MSEDYFALLDQPRKPWLDVDLLKEKYHARAREAQPDENLNEAFRVLTDPKSRLDDLLGTPNYDNLHGNCARLAKDRHRQFWPRRRVARARD